MKLLSLLRRLSFWEGISLLVLFLFAMPLKYYWDMPIFVRIFGMVHGVLWMALVAVLLATHLKLKWGMGKSAQIFVMALLPFGFIEAERVMRGEAERMSGSVV